MRDVKAQDYWRHVFEKNKKNELESFELVSSNISIETIIFRPGVNAVIGRNGAGKTTLLKSIYTSLTSFADKDGIKSMYDLSDTKFSISMRHNNVSGVELKVESEEDIDSIDISDVPINYIDTVNDALKISTFLKQLKDLDEIIEAADEYVLKEDEINELNCIVGKIYKKVSLYEIDAFDHFDAIPFFKLIDSQGIEYDSTKMGDGEFLSFYMWWYFTKKVEPCSIIFVEEPENLLYPNSQRELYKFLLKRADKKKLAIYLTTHSEHILEYIPEDRISVVRYTKDTIENSSVGHKVEYYDEYGISREPGGYIFVEDDASKKLCKFLLSRSKKKLLRDYNIVPMAGGCDVLVDVIKKLSSTDLNFKYMGILDQDKVTEKQAEASEYGILFLPGEVDPDFDLKKLAYEKIEEFANEMHYDKEELERVMPLLETTDKHDWQKKLTEKIGIDEDRIFYALARIFIKDSTFQSTCDAFIKEIEEK